MSGPNPVGNNTPPSNRILSLLHEVVNLVEANRGSDGATPTTELPASTGTGPLPSLSSTTPSAQPSSGVFVTTQSVTNPGSYVSSTFPGMVPMTTSGPSTTTPTSVLAELRSRFQPYSDRSGQRFRVVGRSAGRRSLPQQPPRPFRNKFFCLSEAITIKTPNQSERILLMEQGLGNAVIIADPNASSTELKRLIWLQFPKLAGIEFDLLQCTGTGGYGKPLCRINRDIPVPDVPYLKIARISTIYIRPHQDLIPIEETGPDTSESRDNRRTNALTHDTRGTEGGSQLSSQQQATTSIIIQPSVAVNSLDATEAAVAVNSVDATEATVSVNNVDPAGSPNIPTGHTRDIPEDTRSVRQQETLNFYRMRRMLTDRDGTASAPRSTIDISNIASTSRQGEEDRRSIIVLDAQGHSAPSPGGSDETLDWSDGLDEDTVPTIVSFRDEAIRKHPGLQVVRIFRDNYLERLFGVYKDPKMCLSKELRVEFLGEAGSDYGALTREYFWKGFIALTGGNLGGKSLFEGEIDHKVPTVDSKLLRTGVFGFVGKFIAHAAIHSGIGFLGLSEAVVEYLTTETVNTDTPFSISINDIPDVDHRTVVCNIQKLQSGEQMTDEETAAIKDLASLSDLWDTVCKDNAEEAVTQIMYHQVIERRKAYLEEMKEGLRMTGLLHFVHRHSYTRSGIFPRLKDIKYPLQVVLNRVEFGGNEEIAAMVKAYLTSVPEEKIQALLRGWTGWAVIPEGPLKITIKPRSDFWARTCFNEIIVPEEFDEASIKSSFDSLIENPEGFGEV